MIYLYAHFYNFLFTQTLQRGVALLSYNKGLLRRQNFRDLRIFPLNCWVAFGRPFYLWVVLLGVHRHGRVPPAQGATSPGFYTLWGVIVWRLRRPKKRECQRGRRYFWPCRTRVGFGPATGPTLKTALCHIRALVGRMINNQRSSDALRSRS